ncbi:hypothetical protein BWQ96_04075 [Gracilariopsis chorda]|uniref:Uncharacterized protein n=1 Tax=Gracilariopsis chorda TaxID=448386 RepID=A0A2V3IVM7_9FLOR|nr:hypothetical protein BWQ96_04075 [Gracilariopsis chorda]|eukprot:PXF46198.1 hypothetical protein BWQ96_04075 [Gracilariopsis chorda]
MEHSGNDKGHTVESSCVVSVRANTEVAGDGDGGTDGTGVEFGEPVAADRAGTESQPIADAGESGAVTWLSKRRWVVVRESKDRADMVLQYSGACDAFTAHALPSGT